MMQREIIKQAILTGICPVCKKPLSGESCSISHKQLHADWKLYWEQVTNLRHTLKWMSEKSYPPEKGKFLIYDEDFTGKVYELYMCDVDWESDDLIEEIKSHGIIVCEVDSMLQEFS